MCSGCNDDKSSSDSGGANRRSDDCANSESNEGADSNGESCADEDQGEPDDYYMHSPPTHAYASNNDRLGMCSLHLYFSQVTFNVQIGSSEESRTNTPVSGYPTDREYGSAPGKSHSTLSMIYLIYIDCILWILKNHQVIARIDGQRTIIRTMIVLLMMNPLRYRIIQSGPSG